MKEHITSSNLYLHIPDMVSSIVAMILKDYNNTPFEALMAFYRSSTYSRLENWSTGFWKKTAEELYNDFRTEIHLHRPS